uniref:hypothetical protein n=1 Tax=Flavobacterium sp. TaxID=239 RepID=UPI004049BFEF
AKSWYDKKYSTAELAIKAWNATKKIKGLVNSEMLWHQETASVTPGTSANITSLAFIAQGDTDEGRTGNSILARSINAKISLIMDASATYDFVRVMVLFDLQQISDTPPTAANILEVSTNYQSPLNKATAGRFKVLYNNIYTLNTNYPTRTIEIYKKIYHHVKYNGSANTDIQRGGIYIMLLGSDNSNKTTCNYYYRLGYHDN